MFIWIFYVLTYFYFVGTVHAVQSQNDDNVARIESAAATEKRGRSLGVKLSNATFEPPRQSSLKCFIIQNTPSQDVESYEHEFSIQPNK